MPWPKLPGLILTDTVTCLRRTWGTDSLNDSDPIVLSTSLLTVAAAVQPGDAVSMIEDDDGGLRRLIQEVPYTVDFQQDVGLHARDEIDWTDPATNVTHKITIDGYADLGMRSGTFQAYGKERI